MPDLVFSSTVQALMLNAGAVLILVFALYFRRHGRRDLVLGYVAFNVSLFAVSAALASAGSVSVGVGFGLFAVLSIVRLRSDEATQAEIGYTMIALVLGLLNGLPTLPLTTKALFSVVLVGAVYVVDHPALLPPDRHARFTLTLDVVVTDPAALRDEVARRLGYAVEHVHVQDVDLVRETMRLDVRSRPGNALERRVAEADA